MNDRFGEHGKELLHRFFEPDRGALDFFLGAFVEPLKFNELVQLIKPRQHGSKRVVLIDGHPRTGKTWLSVGALAAAVDEEELNPRQWWTTGVDSISICDSSENLVHACDKVLEQLNQDRKLVFINDFLGTNSLRDLGPVPSRKRLLNFFQWTEENPWLGKLSEGSTLVMVERAMFFTLAEILLNIDIRGLEGKATPSGVEVVLWRHGLFRRKDDGSSFGAFDDETILDILEKNRSLHPLRSKEGEGESWRNSRVLSNAPIVAFDRDRWRDGKDMGVGKKFFTTEEKNIASWSVFGGDLKAIAREVEALEVKSAKSKKDALLAELTNLYMVMVAPALVFLGPNAHESLGINSQKAELFRKKLCMNLEIEESGKRITSERVTNEFYFWTLREHIDARLPLLVRACKRIVAKLELPKDQVERTVGLVLRGVLERILDAKEDRKLKLDEVRGERGAWSFLLEHCGQVDALLYIEGVHGKYQALKQHELAPGLAAAVGWILYRFLYDDQRLRKEIRSWFGDRLKILVGEWEAAGAQQEEVWNRIVGSFSPLFQWSIRAWRERRGSPEELEGVEEIRRSLPSSIRDRMRMILEDELAWGCIYDAKILDDQREWSDPGVQELLTEAFRFLEERPNLGSTGSVDPARVTNRIFSFSWHNEWKSIASGRMGGDERFANKVKGYFEAYKEEALELVDRNPSLLDENLQYHWIHFVTQHAVWMRQWCFELDPDEYERRRGAPGSETSADNDDLVDLFRSLLKNGSTGKRVRNSLFLAGTRAERLHGLELLTAAIDDLLLSDQDHSQEIKIGVSQALFELMRQGYFDQNEKRKLPAHWKNWSREKFSELQPWRHHAWEEYWNELEKLSHKFDLLPSKEEGWRQILPDNWS